MIEKLKEIERKYVELEARSQSPEVVADHVEYRKTVKAMKEIAPIVEKVRERKRIDTEVSGAEEMVSTLPPSDELHALAQQELEGLKAKKSAVDEERRLLLLPK